MAQCCGLSCSLIGTPCHRTTVKVVTISRILSLRHLPASRMLRLIIYHLVSIKTRDDELWMNRRRTRPFVGKVVHLVGVGLYLHEVVEPGLRTSNQVRRGGGKRSEHLKCPRPFSVPGFTGGECPPEPIELSRDFGIASTADVLLKKPPTRTSGTFYFCKFCRKNREPTSGLEPLTCSLRVCGQ
jgi:hypothetical protein